MEASTEYPAVRSGDGYAVGHLDDLGDGPGFRKVRKGLGVTAFGVNAIVLPPGYRNGLSLPRRRRRSCTSSTAARSRWSSATARSSSCRRAAFARVDAATVRKMRNVGEVDAVYVCVGGKDGYVGRDGTRARGRGAAASKRVARRSRQEQPR